MKNTLFAFSLLMAGTVIAPAVPAAETGGVLIVTPDDLKWADTNALPAGAKVAVIEGKMDKKGPITVRIKLPADYKVPAHWHPGGERVTVLSGTFNFGLGDKLDPQMTKALGPGSVIIMPPKTKHFAWTKEETVIQLNDMGPWGITYVNPADNPGKP
ncbi:cupin domain-containing protein [Pseudogulbenkiania subflava]|uniref:Cupin domain-containing protein n=1 Tax=Pseudogulbenkiania subflava DSM 22618 TaxID=1123014 RepID=A0A1Y6BUK1_9NEIS|nr:cupin domain-containing protein [Pseudogulbenkiania subflava]SMF28755.1 Cupin domain-containing protein [Pseudogulbenkiania subflava DSM 22618]